MENKFYVGMRVKATNKMLPELENKCFGTIVKVDKGNILVEWDKENGFMHCAETHITDKERRFPGQDSCFFCCDYEIAPLNRLERVADALGLYEGQRFDIYDEDGDRLNYGPYMFDGENFVDCNDDVLSMGEYKALIEGYIETPENRVMQLKEEIQDLQDQIEEKENELARIREGA